MGQLNLEKTNNFSDTKSNEEIIKLIEEIKALEKKFENYDGKKIDANKERIESETELLEEFQPIEAIEEKNVSGSELLEEFKPIDEAEEIKDPIFDVELKNLEHASEIKKERSKKLKDPATFIIRFNDEGKFENIDVTKRKLTTEPKKPFILKRIKIRKKENTESEETEEKSKFSRLKSGLAKLKSIIPNKSEEIEEAEETVNEE